MILARSWLIDHAVAWHPPLRKATTPVIVGPAPSPNREEYPYQATIEFQGALINVENLRGTTRSGTDVDGKPWSVKMTAHYGEFVDTLGTDGDPVDVFVGPDAGAQVAYVFHTKHPGTQVFDEDKVVIGCRTQKEAERLVRDNYNRNGMIAGCTPWPLAELLAELDASTFDGEKLDRPKKVRAVVGLDKGRPIGGTTGMVLKPTKKNPRIRRWQRSDQFVEPSKPKAPEDPNKRPELLTEKQYGEMSIDQLMAIEQKADTRRGEVMKRRIAGDDSPEIQALSRRLTGILHRAGSVRLEKTRAAKRIDDTIANGAHMRDAIPGVTDTSTMAEVEDAIRGFAEEHMVFSTPDGRHLARSTPARTRRLAPGANPANSCAIGKDQSDAVKGTDAVMTHNHPSGSNFSTPDFAVAAHLNLSQMRAARPQGGTWVVNRPDGGWPQSHEWGRVLQRAVGEATTAMDNIVREDSGGEPDEAPEGKYTSPEWQQVFGRLWSRSIVELARTSADIHVYLEGGPASSRAPTDVLAAEISDALREAKSGVAVKALAKGHVKTHMRTLKSGKRVGVRSHHRDTPPPKGPNEFAGQGTIGQSPFYLKRIVNKLLAQIPKETKTNKGHTWEAYDFTGLFKPVSGYHFVTTADGKTDLVTFLLAPDPTAGNKIWGGTGWHETRPDERYVVLYIDPQAWSGGSPEIVEQQLEAVVAHEVAHLMDPTTHLNREAGVTGDDAKDAIGQGDESVYQAYLNHPVEVTAHLQEAVHELQTPRNKQMARKLAEVWADHDRTAGRVARVMLNMNTVFSRVQDHLTPANRKRFMATMGAMVADMLKGDLHTMLKATISTPKAKDGKVDYDNVPVGSSIWVTVTDESSPLHGRPILISKRPDSSFALIGGSGSKHIQARKHLVMGAGKPKATKKDEAEVQKRAEIEERNAPKKAAIREFRQQARAAKTKQEAEFMEALGMSGKGLSPKEKERVHASALQVAEKHGLEGSDAESYAKHLSNGLAQKQKKKKLQTAAHGLDVARRVLDGNSYEDALEMAGGAPEDNGYSAPAFDPSTWAPMDELERENAVKSDLDRQESDHLIEQAEASRFDGDDDGDAEDGAIALVDGAAGIGDDLTGQDGSAERVGMDEPGEDTPPMAMVGPHGISFDGDDPDPEPEPAVEPREILDEDSARAAVEAFQKFAEAQKAERNVRKALEDVPQVELAAPATVEELRLKAGLLDEGELESFLDEYRNRAMRAPDDSFYNAIGEHWNEHIGNKINGAVVNGAASAIAGIVGEELSVRYDVQQLVDALGPEGAAMATVARMREELSDGDFKDWLERTRDNNVQNQPRTEKVALARHKELEKQSDDLERQVSHGDLQNEAMVSMLRARNLLAQRENLGSALGSMQVSAAMFHFGEEAWAKDWSKRHPITINVGSKLALQDKLKRLGKFKHRVSFHPQQGYQIHTDTVALRKYVRRTEADKADNAHWRGVKYDKSGIVPDSEGREWVPDYKVPGFRSNFPGADQLPIDQQGLAGKQVSLMADQRNNIEWIHGSGGGLISMRTGGGKTLVSIGVAGKMLKDNPHGMHLRVVPDNREQQWAAEIRNFTNMNPVVLPGKSTKAERHAILAAAPPGSIVLVSHKNAGRYDHEALNTMHEWDSIGVDEPQELKSRTGSGKMSAGGRRIFKLQANNKHGITATPANEYATEAYDIVNWARPKVLGHRTKFARSYAGFGSGTNAQDAALQKMLFRELEPHMSGDRMVAPHYKVNRSDNRVSMSEAQLTRQREIESTAQPRIDAKIEEFRQKKRDGVRGYADKSWGALKRKATEKAMDSIEAEHRGNLGGGTAQENAKLRGMLDKVQGADPSQRHAIFVDSGDQRKAVQQALYGMGIEKSKVKNLTKDVRGATVKRDGKVVGATEERKRAWKTGEGGFIILDRTSAAGHNLAEGHHLHVIGNPDDAAQMLQVHGRLGRANRQGDFSIHTYRYDDSPFAHHKWNKLDRQTKMLRATVPGMFLEGKGSEPPAQAMAAMAKAAPSRLVAHRPGMVLRPSQKNPSVRRWHTTAPLPAKGEWSPPSKEDDLGPLRAFYVHAVEAAYEDAAEDFMWMPQYNDFPEDNEKNLGLLRKYADLIKETALVDMLSAKEYRTETGKDLWQDDDVVEGLFRMSSAVQQRATYEHIHKRPAAPDAATARATAVKLMDASTSMEDFIGKMSYILKRGDSTMRREPRGVPEMYSAAGSASWPTLKTLAKRFIRRDELHEQATLLKNAAPQHVRASIGVLQEDLNSTRDKLDDIGDGGFSGSHWGSADSTNPTALGVAWAGGAEFRPLDNSMKPHTKGISFSDAVRGVALRVYAQRKVKQTPRSMFPTVFRGMGIPPDLAEAIGSGKLGAIPLTGCTAFSFDPAIADRYSGSDWTAQIAGHDAVPLVIEVERTDSFDDSLGMWMEHGDGAYPAFEVLSAGSMLHITDVHVKGTRAEFDARLTEAFTVGVEYAKASAVLFADKTLGQYEAEAANPEAAKVYRAMRSNMEGAKREWRDLPDEWEEVLISAYHHANDVGAGRLAGDARNANRRAGGDGTTTPGSVEDARQAWLKLDVEDGFDRSGYPGPEAIRVKAVIDHNPHDHLAKAAPSRLVAHRPGMVLRPSQKNPSVRRWHQTTPQQTAPGVAPRATRNDPGSALENAINEGLHEAGAYITRSIDRKVSLTGEDKLSTTPGPDGESPAAAANRVTRFALREVAVATMAQRKIDEKMEESWSQDHHWSQVLAWQYASRAADLIHRSAARSAYAIHGVSRTRRYEKAAELINSATTLHDFTKKISDHEKLPDFPNIFDVESIQELTERVGWKGAAKMALQRMKIDELKAKVHNLSEERLDDTNHTHDLRLGALAKFRQAFDNSMGDSGAIARGVAGDHWGSADSYNDVARGVAWAAGAEYRPIDKDMQPHTEPVGRKVAAEATQRYNYAQRRVAETSREEHPEVYRGMAIPRRVADAIAAGKLGAIPLTGATAFSFSKAVADHYGSSQWTGRLSESGSVPIVITVKRTDSFDESLGMWHEWASSSWSRQHSDESTHPAFEVLSAGSMLHIADVQSEGKLSDYKAFVSRIFDAPVAIAKAKAAKDILKQKLLQPHLDAWMKENNAARVPHSVQVQLLAEVDMAPLDKAWERVTLARHVSRMLDKEIREGPKHWKRGLFAARDYAGDTDFGETPYLQRLAWQAYGQSREGGKVDYEDPGPGRLLVTAVIDDDPTPHVMTKAVMLLGGAVLLP